MYNVTLYIQCSRNAIPLSYPKGMIDFHTKGEPLQRFIVVGNSNTYLGLHVRLPTFLPNFSQIWNFSTNFHKKPHTTFNGNQFSGNR